jgi:hypothetical protein
MNISWRLLFCTAAASVAVALTAACGDSSASGPSELPNTGTSVSTPATSPETSEPSSPAPTMTVTKTVTPPVAVTPAPTQKPTTPTVVVPTAKPTAPTGPASIKVRSYAKDKGNYPKFVRKDPTRSGSPLICASTEARPIVLKLDETTPTGGKNLVSTIVTKAGLLVFAQKGSVLPSDTLILDERLYGNVPAQLLDPDKKGEGYSMLLPSTSVAKGGWGKFTSNTELVVCRPT